MKKGESIRLEIKSVSSAGLVLYSYKKKAEILLDSTQLKAGFSKEKYQNLIGSPIVLRLISTRPTIRVSEKFIHKDAPIFDDYALRPKESVREPKRAVKQNDESVSIQKMIQNKVVIITKENQFDKGWTLFHPYESNIRENQTYRETFISDVIRLITHSDEVNLVLSEPCLSSRIINEIEWANKYIKLNIIAKDKSILKRYDSFHFSSIKIDESVDFNYIGIIGKESGFFIVSDGFVTTDDRVDRVYFRNEKGKKEYSFLETVDTIVIVDEKGTGEHSELIKEAKKAGVECRFAVNSAFYNRRIFDLAKKEGLVLLASNYTKNGVILIKKDKTLACLNIGSKGFFIIHPIAKINEYLGQEYRCGFYSDTIDTKSIKGETYTCHNGKLTKLSIAENKIVSIDVPIKEMSAFVKEQFDSSVVEKHNDYSAEAKKVEYRFTLIPPLFDKKFVESDIYVDLHSLHKKWKTLQTLDTERIKTDYLAFMEKDFGILDFLDSTLSFTDSFSKKVKSCSYKGYYAWAKATVDLYQYYDEKLVDVCVNIFKAINSESSGTKFDKFDDEIAGYRQTIKEKKDLIEKKIDVLRNQRRVDILTKKIEDLLELKRRFENTSDSRNDKTQNAFATHCLELLSASHKADSSESIGSIVKPKEETKTAKLYGFVDAHLSPIKRYISNCIPILDKMLSVHIPEDYPVYEKDGERFIVIDDLKEFDQTKQLRDEFDLKCVARR